MIKTMSEKTDCPVVQSIPLFNYMTGDTIYDTLHSKADRVRQINTILIICKNSFFWSIFVACAVPNQLFFQPKSHIYLG